MSKRLYENLDYIAAETRGGDETLAEIVTELTGLVWEPSTHERDEGWVLDPDLAEESRRLVYRWLRDHGYQPRT